MNRVNCPECGCIMDGASVRCPKCRFPIGKFSESGNAEGGAIVITQEEFSALKSEMTGVRPWYTEIKDKKLVRKIIPIIIVTIILCVAAAAVVLFADSGRRGAEPQVTEMKLGRNMKLNGINAIRVKTDETAPFAAVFRDTRNDKLMYSVMEGGSGTIFPENNEITVKDIEPVGYSGGYKVSYENVLFFEKRENIKNDNTGLYDCYLTVVVETDEDKNGIMIADFHVLSSYEKNIAVDIINGKGMLHRKISGLQSKIREAVSYFSSHFFIPSRQISESDYSLTQEIEMTISSENNSFNIKGEAKLNNEKNAVLFYSYEIFSGSEMAGKGHSFVYSENGVCKLDNEHYIGKRINNISSYKVYFTELISLKPLPELKSASSA